MRKIILSALAVTAFIPSLFAQRWHIKPTPEEIEYRKKLPKQVLPSNQKPTASTYVMPAGARFPGEFEESQAVSLAWVDDFPGPGPDVTSEYGNLWAQMADAIQKECPVWIRIKAGADSNTIKTYMAGRGTPLTNYRFDVMVGDDFWIRDFGPLSFYYGANDDIGMLDMNYYDGRDYDDLYPGLLANKLGYLDVKTTLYAEGGNFITDGFNRSFYSDVIHDENMTWPQPKHTPWTLAKTLDTLKYIWASPFLDVSPGLQCDGGTEHNDMYMKLMDENTFAIMEYPSVVTASDKAIITNVINSLANTNSVYGKKYRIFKLPMPRQDNGDTLKSCAQIDGDARTFVNGLTVNKTYLMPAFSDNTSGMKADDSTAIEIFKRNAPGYKIVPLDSRMLTIAGGAVHCVTMQIPAENPVTFWHPPIQDEQPLSNTFHLVSKITNKSGIASSKCMWRKRGTTSGWNTANLTDSSGYMIGDITGSFSYMEGVEYYLTATTNNGKTAVKPIVAPDGYYTFYFPFPAGVGQLNPERNFALNPIPNPTAGDFVIPVSFDKTVQVKAYITDVMGKRIATIDFGSKNNGLSKLDFNLNNASAGMYFIQITADGQVLDTKKVMKQ